MFIWWLAFESNPPNHSGEHVEMDFMKLFGTVIAVLFHPGSAFKLNGKYEKKEKKSTTTALERWSFIWFGVMYQLICVFFFIFLCNTDYVLMEFIVFARTASSFFSFFLSKILFQTPAGLRYVRDYVYRLPLQRMMLWKISTSVFTSQITGVKSGGLI